MVANVIGLGLKASEHALLGGVMEFPASGGVVLTGRLSPNMQGWLADHAVSGVVMFPAAAFLELAIRAGDEVGCLVVNELTFQAPLILSARNFGLVSFAMQVVLGPLKTRKSEGIAVFRFFRGPMPVPNGYVTLRAHWARGRLS